MPATVDTLGKAIRHELERCAGVLFGHDRALGALATRLDAVEASAPAPAIRPPTSWPSGPGSPRRQSPACSNRSTTWTSGIVAMETRVEPLEPLPTVVQALRRAVRASDDLIAGETARPGAGPRRPGRPAGRPRPRARDDALRRLVAQDLDRVSGVSAAQAKGLADLAERLAASRGPAGAARQRARRTSPPSAASCAVSSTPSSPTTRPATRCCAGRCRTRSTSSGPRPRPGRCWPRR